MPQLLRCATNNDDSHDNTSDDITMTVIIAIIEAMLIRSVFKISCLFLWPRPWQFDIWDSTDKWATYFYFRIWYAQFEVLRFEIMKTDRNSNNRSNDNMFAWAGASALEACDICTVWLGTRLYIYIYILLYIYIYIHLCVYIYIWAGAAALEEPSSTPLLLLVLVVWWFVYYHT